MKNKIAKLLVRLALKLDPDSIYESFESPSINIMVKLERGLRYTQTYGYKEGEDFKCVKGLTEILGYNPYEGLLDILNESEGEKKNAKSVSFQIDGNKNAEIKIDGEIINQED